MGVTFREVIYAGITATGAGFAVMKNAVTVPLVTAGLVIVAAGLLAFEAGVWMAVLR